MPAIGRMHPSQSSSMFDMSLCRNDHQDKNGSEEDRLVLSLFSAASSLFVLHLCEMYGVTGRNANATVVLGDGREVNFSDIEEARAFQVRTYCTACAYYGPKSDFYVAIVQWYTALGIYSLTEYGEFLDVTANLESYSTSNASDCRVGESMATFRKGIDGLISNLPEVEDRAALQALFENWAEPATASSKKAQVSWFRIPFCYYNYYCYYLLLLLCLFLFLLLFLYTGSEDEYFPSGKARQQSTTAGCGQENHSQA